MKRTFEELLARYRTQEAREQARRYSLIVASERRCSGCLATVGPCRRYCDECARTKRHLAQFRFRRKQADERDLHERRTCFGRSIPSSLLPLLPTIRALTKKVNQ